ncbi:hypothetical protein OIU77_026118 [Salix suchowensis]|uniref:Uncharacterized protein n=1 Tax=Salix suchowensis TaxID=1278906 RepID=A0ABQ9C0D4_9ROSI|nr:hypothetical protein OIU77_026118 [Salix suchowensis]
MQFIYYRAMSLPCHFLLSQRKLLTSVKKKKIEPPTQPQHQHPAQIQPKKLKIERKDKNSRNSLPLSILFSFQVILTLLTTSIVLLQETISLQVGPFNGERVGEVIAKKVKSI